MADPRTNGLSRIDLGQHCVASHSVDLTVPGGTVRIRASIASKLVPIPSEVMFSGNEMEGQYEVPIHLPEVLAFDDLQIGDEWESPGRTITETDVVLFAGLSGDYNPLHTNHELSKVGPFGRPVAHGLLGLSVATGLISQSPRVDTLAFLAILQWRFILPIEFGDTIKVLSRVEDKEAQARGRRGIVTWHRRILNQASRLVQEGRTQTLVRGRTRSRANGPSDREPG